MAEGEECNLFHEGESNVPVRGYSSFLSEGISSGKVGTTSPDLRQYLKQLFEIAGLYAFQ